MFAKLVLGMIDPHNVDAAALAVDQELIPLFIAKEGARQGYWMADRKTGEVLTMTIWSCYQAMEDARAADGAERARVVERIGMRTLVTLALNVIGAEHGDTADETVLRWARVTWVEGLDRDRLPALVASYKRVLPDQALSSGFCGSYWLADASSGNGLALSFWEGPQELRRGEHVSRRRRRKLEAEHGFRVDRVVQYEALGVALHRVASGVEVLPQAWATSSNRWRGLP